MSLAPITSLPSNAYLPKSVHKLADEWRAADQRVNDILKQRNDANASIGQAKADDAEALKAAALSGAPLPDKEHEKATLALIDDSTRRLPHAEAERDRLGRLLVVALRDDDARRHLTETAAASAQASLAAYLETLDDAEKKVTNAHQALTDATAALSVIEALDTGAQVRLMARPPKGAPTFGPARAGVAQLAQQLAALGERKRPRERHIRLTDGREVHVVASLAADFHRDGKVTEWLDGWPPEKPSPRLAGNALLDDFRNTPTHFAPRGDAA